MLRVAFHCQPPLVLVFFHWMSILQRGNFKHLVWCHIWDSYGGLFVIASLLWCFAHFEKSNFSYQIRVLQNENILWVGFKQLKPTGNTLCPQSIWQCIRSFGIVGREAKVVKRQGLFSFYLFIYLFIHSFIHLFFCHCTAWGPNYTYMYT